MNSTIRNAVMLHAGVVDALTVSDSAATFFGRKNLKVLFVF